MAVEPLYTADKDEFLKKIRLLTAKSEQTLAVIDVAISEVRVGFFNAITSDRALEIAGFADSDNPTTEEEILKSTAAVAEVQWVTAILIELLPNLFMDGKVEVNQVWNEEPLTRNSSELLEYKDSLLAKVQVLLGRLEEPENDNTGPVKVNLIGREEPFIIASAHPGKLGISGV
jgi:hypothetical protein